MLLDGIETSEQLTAARDRDASSRSQSLGLTRVVGVSRYAAVRAIVALEWVVGNIRGHQVPPWCRRVRCQQFGRLHNPLATDSHTLGSELVLDAAE